MIQASTGDTFEELYGRGTLLLHEGKTGQAAEILEKAHQLNPDHVDTSLNLGGALVLLGRFKDAVELLEDTAGRNPDNAMAWTNLGAAYLGNPVLARAEDQQQAIDAFTRALEIDPQAPSVAYNIGLIYRDRRQWSEAAYWFQEAINRDPRDKDARALHRKTISLLKEQE